MSDKSTSSPVGARGNLWSGVPRSVLLAAGPHLAESAFGVIEDAIAGSPFGLAMWSRIARVLVLWAQPGALGIPDDQVDAWFESAWRSTTTQPRSKGPTRPGPAPAPQPAPIRSVPGVGTSLGAARAYPAAASLAPPARPSDRSPTERRAVPSPLASPALLDRPRRETPAEKFARRSASDPMGQTVQLGPESAAARDVHDLLLVCADPFHRQDDEAGSGTAVASDPARASVASVAPSAPSIPAPRGDVAAPGRESGRRFCQVLVRRGPGDGSTR